MALLEKLQKAPFSGRVADKTDPRDFHLARGSVEAIRLRQCLDERRKAYAKTTAFSLEAKYFGKVKNQEHLNNCCACAATALMEYRARKDRGLSDLECSVGFLHKATRDFLKRPGNAATDSRTTMKALTLVGVTEEKMYPTTEANVDVEPGNLNYAVAANFKATGYWRVDSEEVAKRPQLLLEEIKQTLLADVPLMFSVHFQVETTLQDFAVATAKLEKIPLPEPQAMKAFAARRLIDRALGRVGDSIGAAVDLRAARPSDAQETMREVQRLLGIRPGKRRTPAQGATTTRKVASFVGHSLVACGFDDTKQAILVRNSWSNEWGNEGYGWLPYEYVLQGLTEDWWFISSASFIDTTPFAAGGGGGAGVTVAGLRPAVTNPAGRSAAPHGDGAV